ncbi:MAG: carbohydrate ABC transporter permease [Clostridiaceae bacterium]|nr:carbohydrate ABC transporter permease [Clostridiaceae bacterium]
MTKEFLYGKKKINNHIRIPRSDRIYNTIVNIFLAIFFLIILIPLLNIVASSFSNAQEVNAGNVYIWPIKPTLKGYEAVFNYQGIWRSYWNTIIYTVTGTCINIWMTMFCAYPFARKNLPMKKPLMWLFLFTMFFSGGMIPTYLNIRSLHMMNSIWALVLPGAISIYNMIIARTFIQNIPIDMEEAAKIDGCSDFYYFFRIVLPLSKTVIAVLSLYYAVAHWNSYMDAFLYLNDNDKMPLQITLRNILLLNAFLDEASMNEETYLSNKALQDLLKYSLIIVSSVPILCVYPFVKKYFLKGVMIGALKG